MDNKINNLHIGVVIPAHNEVETIGDCLKSVTAAIKQLPASVNAKIIVMLDSCTDGTEEIVQALNVNYMTCNYKCVGKVRDKGVRHAISQGANWIACTDADSIVEIDWLTQQLAHTAEKPTDMICGVVSIKNWSGLLPQTRADYMTHYQDKMGHKHIHGANLSFKATSYLQVGGFEALENHEDVTLVKKFQNSHFYGKQMHITWSNKVRVVTSSRLNARTSEGFANFLSELENKEPE